ncbi:MAG: multidrug effflux MFS transporter [Rhodobacteraceae bacterium]|nr:multidrug effflux MFS transporter [Paracoccaceae bacterium]
MSTLQAAKLFDRTTPPHIITLILLASVGALSITVFLPSLPNMTRYFDTDYRLMQLSVAAYLLVNGILHIVIGPLSDRFGRRPVTIWSILLFLAATLGCIVAPTVELFLAFRMAQAVIVTGIVLSRAIVRDMVPQSEAASKIGYVTMGMALVPMIAPVIGGYLDEIAGWKASFALLFAMGLLILTFVVFDQGETALSRSSSFRQQFRDYPELFSSRRFWGYVAISGSASGLFFAYLGAAPLIGTVHYELVPSRLGFYFGLTAFGYMLGNFLSGRYSIRLGINRMILLGAVFLVIAPVGALGAEFLNIAHPLGFFLFTIIMGIGNGIILPNATSGMLSVRPHLAGTASGVGGAIAIGTGAGVSALAGALLSEEASPMPLILIMLACVLLCLAVTFYVLIVEKSLSSDD